LNDSAPTRIPGVSWRGDSQLGRTRESRPGSVLRQAQHLPLPARDLIDLSAYRDAWQQAHGFFSLNLIASRGCPFRCNWCAKPIFGDSYQLRPAREVACEMKILKEQYAADHLWFADDIFGLNRHWLEEFAAAVEEFGCATPFKVQARADLLSAQSARALKRAGCAEVWMGVESGSQKILDAMDKGLRVEEVIAARNHLKREGIRTGYFLQLGYPGESWADIQKTIALVRETQPDDIGVSFSYPLPNTRFHERVKVQLGAKQNWSDSDDLCVMFQGTYTDGFYRAIRDALHLEVESRHFASPDLRRAGEIAEAWRAVETLEPASRNLHPTELPHAPVLCGTPVDPHSSHFVPLPALAASTGDAND
jgi:anaerobic magnesium-protoporphyrin IX monomethyl ester cyclase